MKPLLVSIVATVLLVGCAIPVKQSPTSSQISIHEAAGNEDINADTEYLNFGADLEAKDEKYGETPLHFAAYHGQKEVVALLIAKGAGVNTRDKDGWTPLDETIKNKHTTTADLLRKHDGETSEELKAEGKLNSPRTN